MSRTPESVNSLNNGGSLFGRDDPEKFARLLVEEQDSYGREITSTVIKSGLVVSAVFAYIGLVIWAVSLSGSSSPDRPTFTMAPLSSSAIFAIYAGLAALVLSLQAVARLPIEEKPRTRRLARSLASRQSISATSLLTVAVSLAIGMYVFGQHLALGAEEMDIVRTLGPPLVSIGFAFLAAEAQVLTALRRDAFLVEAETQRDLERLQEALSFYSNDVSPTSGMVRIQRIAMFIVTPMAVVFASYGLSGPGSVEQHIGFAMGGVASTLAAYLVLKQITKAIVLRAIGALVGWFLLLAALGSLAFIAIITSYLEPEDEVWDLGDLQIVAWVTLVVAPLAVAALFSAQGRPRRGFILEDGVRQVRAKRDSLTQNNSREKPSPLHPFVWLTMLSCLIFPVCAVVAQSAYRVIPLEDTRSRRWVKNTRRVSAVAVLALFAAIVCLALVRPVLA